LFTNTGPAKNLPASVQPAGVTVTAYDADADPPGPSASGDAGPVLAMSHAWGRRVCAYPLGLKNCR
jgi:hypothetical protein